MLDKDRWQNITTQNMSKPISPIMLLHPKTTFYSLKKKYAKHVVHKQPSIGRERKWKQPSF